MPEYNTRVECPKCLRNSFILSGYEDYGDYDNPPSFDFDIKQECSCKFTDDEWNDLHEDFLNLFMVGEQIGQMEHALVELECRMSSEDCPESEAEKMMLQHDKISNKIQEFLVNYNKIHENIYGVDI